MSAVSALEAILAHLVNIEADIKVLRTRGESDNVGIVIKRYCPDNYPVVPYVAEKLAAGAP